MSSYEIVRYTHIGVGALALGTFWIGGLTRKGSRLHKGAGKVYLGTMAVVLASSVPLTVTLALQRSAVVGAFLAYLLVITASGVWQAWRAIKDKSDFAAYTGPVYRVLAWLNLLSGAALLTLGVQRGILLFAGFSLVGIIGGWSMLRFARRAPDDPRWWLREHLSAMVGNGVATHIAFLAIGLPRLVPALDTPAYQYAGWFGPVIVAQIAGALLRRRFLAPRANAQSQRSSLTQTAPESTLTGNLAVGS